MSDPLADIVALLKPSAAYSKLVMASGAWAVRRSAEGEPFYCVVLSGGCRLSVEGMAPIRLEGGDFVLVPAAHAFETTSLVVPPGGVEPARVEISPGVFRIGNPEEQPDVRLLIGHCTFGSPDADLLVSLLPRLVLIHGESRLTTLVGLLDMEARTDRPGRGAVLARLLEVLLIEAFRSTAGASAPPGLLRGLADARLSVGLRRMHARPAEAWTVPELAKSAGLSRSTFYERFRREVGVPPMAYLMAWRMALAKDLLRRGATGVAEVAGQVGYGSASAFSVAFARRVGTPPIAYAREARSDPDRSRSLAAIDRAAKPGRSGDGGRVEGTGGEAVGAARGRRASLRAGSGPGARSAAS